MEALKSRAVLKELEEIKEYFIKNNMNIKVMNFSCKDSLTQNEAAKKAGIDKSIVSRYPEKFGAFRNEKGQLRYSTEKVREAAEEYSTKSKPGRKTNF
jgi:predicted XRE-type DNA-binding protein